MGFLSDTVDRKKVNEKKKEEKITVKTVKVSSNEQPAEEKIPAPDSVLEMLEYFGMATAATRQKVKDMARRIDESEEDEFCPVWVKKDAPTGDYILTKMSKSSSDYKTSEELEAEAAQKWGVDGYTRVYRVVESNDPLKLAEEIATKEQVAEILKQQAARKKKAREAK